MRARKTLLLPFVALLAGALLGLAVIRSHDDPVALAAPEARMPTARPGPELVRTPASEGRTLAPAPTETDTDLAASARPAGAERIHGRLVDANTLEPLPHAQLWFRPEGATDTAAAVRSDENGDFTTELPFAHGTVEAAWPWGGSARIHPRNLWHAFDHRPTTAGDPPPLFGIRSGPTYHLRIAVPTGVKLRALGAELRWADTGQQSPVTLHPPQAELPADRRFVLLDESRGFELHRERLSDSLGKLPPIFSRLAPVREKEWVRFPMPLRVVAESLPESQRGRWTLRVVDVSGMWRGEVPVTSIHGADHPPLVVRLEPRGELVPTVTNLAGELLKGVELRLEPELGTSVLEEQDALLPDRMRRFVGLVPGFYRLTASAPDHAPKELTVEVQAAQATEVSIRLAADVQGSISGEVRSQSGGFCRKVTMVLAPAGDEWAEYRRSQRYAAVVWTEREGRWHGRFHFADVPQGSYRLSPIAGTFFEWRPPSSIVEAPAEAISFECRDTGTRSDLYVRAFDGESRDLLDAFRVTVSSRIGPRQISYGRELRRAANAGTGHPVSLLRIAEGFPLDGELAVTMDTSGYEPVEVDLSAFAETEVHGVPARLADVVLERRDP